MTVPLACSPFYSQCAHTLDELFKSSVQTLRETELRVLCENRIFAFASSTAIALGKVLPQAFRCPIKWTWQGGKCLKWSTYIFDSLLGAPPVTLATLRAANSVFSSFSCGQANPAKNVRVLSKIVLQTSPTGSLHTLDPRCSFHKTTSPWVFKRGTDDSFTEKQLTMRRVLSLTKAHCFSAVARRELAALHPPYELPHLNMQSALNKPTRDNQLLIKYPIGR
jgi:hypothetical protein